MLLDGLFWLVVPAPVLLLVLLLLLVLVVVVVELEETGGLFGFEVLLVLGSGSLSFGLALPGLAVFPSLF